MDEIIDCFEFFADVNLAVDFWVDDFELGEGVVFVELVFVLWRGESCIDLFLIGFDVVVWGVEFDDVCFCLEFFFEVL